MDFQATKKKTLKKTKIDRQAIEPPFYRSSESKKAFASNDEAQIQDVI